MHCVYMLGRRSSLHLMMSQSVKTGWRCELWSVCGPHQGRAINQLCHADVTTRYAASGISLEHHHHYWRVCGCGWMGWCGCEWVVVGGFVDCTYRVSVQLVLVDHIELLGPSHTFKCLMCNAWCSTTGISTLLILQSPKTIFSIKTL